MKKTAVLLIASLACSSAYAFSLGDLLSSIFKPPKHQISSGRSPSSVKHPDLFKNISCTFHGKNNYGVNPDTVYEFPDPDQTVCDPLSGTPSESRTNGLSAKIYLPGPDMAMPVASVMDYYNKGVRLSEDVYFASINIPTRSFTKGFITEGGSVLLNSDGSKLVENFGLEYNSILKLSNEDKEGEYELASVSDDGARVFFKENNQWKELINNDGNHSTRMGCAYRTISLKRDTEVPIKVFYFQGSGNYVANVLLWKHHKDAKAYKRSVLDNFACGKSGNNLFYHSGNEKPTVLMKWLQASGWKAISNANYKMPEKKSNPCTVEPFQFVGAPSAVALTATSAAITWKTNYPSTSQIRISNITTGQTILTEKNADMVTDHEVHVSGITVGFTYDITVISVDEKGVEIESTSIGYP